MRTEFIWLTIVLIVGFAIKLTRRVSLERDKKIVPY